MISRYRELFPDIENSISRYREIIPDIGKWLIKTQLAFLTHHTYQATQTPLFSNPLMYVTLWYPGVPRTPNLFKISRTLKVILEMNFSAHCTQIWKWNRISMTIISKVTSLTFDQSSVSWSMFEHCNGLRSLNVQLNLIPYICTIDSYASFFVWRKF